MSRSRRAIGAGSGGKIPTCWNSKILGLSRKGRKQLFLFYAMAARGKAMRLALLWPEPEKGGRGKKARNSSETKEFSELPYPRKNVPTSGRFYGPRSSAPSARLAIERRSARRSARRSPGCSRRARRGGDGGCRDRGARGCRHGRCRDNAVHHFHCCTGFSSAFPPAAGWPGPSRRSFGRKQNRLDQRVAIMAALAFPEPEPGKRTDLSGTSVETIEVNTPLWKPKRMRAFDSKAGRF